MSDPHDAIDRDFDAHLERIREFLRIPSVSAADGDLRCTADAVCRLIELAGGTRRAARAGREAADRDRRDRRPRRRPCCATACTTCSRRAPSGRSSRSPPRCATGASIARGAANSKGALAASILAFASAPEPVPPGVRVRGRGGARQPAARRVLRRPPRRAGRRLRARLRPAGAARVGVRGRQGPVRARADGGRRARTCTPRASPRWPSRRSTSPARSSRSRRRVPGRERHLDDRRHARGRQPHGRRRGRRARASTSGSTEDAVDLPRAADGVALRRQGHLSARALGPGRRRRCRALCEALRRHGTEPQVRPVAPWWAPYHVFGDVPFASGGPGTPAARTARTSGPRSTACGASCT